MALVILSDESVTRSRTRTVSLRAFASLGALVVAGVLSTGVLIGYVVAERTAGDRVTAAQPVQQPMPRPVVLEVSQPGGETRRLIERFSELSGRLIQLEAESRELASRVGIMQEFETRLTPKERARAEEEGRVARTQPGEPAGGPLLSPRDQAPMLTTPARLAEDEDVAAALGLMEQDIDRLGELFGKLDRSVVDMNLAHMAFPGRKPVEQGKAITSSFGSRVDPFSRGRAFHSGVDYPAPPGTPIYASAGGKVIFSGTRGQYGRTVEIDHGGGVVSRYAHASELLVEHGQVVMPGEEIARVGSSGRSTGPHLHFEILKDGRFVDPEIYLARFE